MNLSNQPMDRFKRAVQAFVREMFPTLDYMGKYEYVVVLFDVNSQLADLQPVDSTIGLPPIIHCSMRLPGVVLDLEMGTSVMVSFENHNPAKPFVDNFDRFASGGFVPSFTGLAGALPTDTFPTADAVARKGDSVTSHSFMFNPGSGGATLTIDGNPIGISPTVVPSVITTGSSKVKCA